MRIRIEALVNALLLAAALFIANGIAIPSIALACSCAPPEPIAAASGPRRAIVVATIGRAVPGGTAIAVEGVFTGPVPADQMLIRGIGGQGASCEHGAGSGQRWLLVLFRDDDGIYSTNSCMSNAMIGTPEGDATLGEALAAFGEPSAAATSEPEAPAPLDLSPWLGGLGWVAAVVAVGAAVLGLVAVVARRRPTD